MTVEQITSKTYFNEIAVNFLILDRMAKLEYPRLRYDIGFSWQFDMKTQTGKDQDTCTCSSLSPYPSVGCHQLKYGTAATSRPT